MRSREDDRVQLDGLIAASEQPPPLLAFVHIPKTAGATTKVRTGLRDAGTATSA